MKMSRPKFTTDAEPTPILPLPKIKLGQQNPNQFFKNGHTHNEGVIPMHTFEATRANALDQIVVAKSTSRQKMKSILRQACDWLNSLHPTTDQYVEIAAMEQRLAEHKLRCQTEMRRFF